MVLLADIQVVLARVLDGAGWNTHNVTIGPHRQGIYPADIRPAGAQLDKPRQNTPFATLAPLRPQLPLDTSTAPSMPGPRLNLRPSDRQK